MATFTHQFFLLLEADQKDIVFKSFKMIPSIYPEIFVVRKSNRAYEDALRIGALGTFREKLEGHPVHFDDPVQGTQVRHPHQSFALAWRATREMIRDDQHGVMNQMSSDLGDSARDHRERLAWDVINDGYTGTRHTGLENEVLFSATHTRLKAGGTASNILVPPIALSQSGIEGMMDLSTSMTSDEGRFIMVDYDTLVIHPAQQHNAYVLLNTEYKPGSSNNDRSTVVSSRSGMKVINNGKGVPYLSSTTRWSVHAKSERGLHWTDRDPLEFAQAADADTFDRKFYASYRAHAGFWEWRFSFGSGAL